MAVTQLSRSEVMTLLYDKVHLIRSEAEEIEGEGEVRLNLTDAKKRLKRIAVEAKRCASLIETYQAVATAGHCLHCGKPYSEHHELSAPLPEGAPRVRVKGDDPNAVACRALQRLFESVEVEAYQGFKIEEQA